MGFKRSVVFALSRELGRKHLKKQLDLVNNWVGFWLNQGHKKSTLQSKHSTSRADFSGSASPTWRKTRLFFGSRTMQGCHTQIGLQINQITTNINNTVWGYAKRTTITTNSGMTENVQRRMNIFVSHVSFLSTHIFKIKL